MRAVRGGRPNSTKLTEFFQINGMGMGLYGVAA